MAPLAIGIDLGGTKIEATVLSVDDARPLFRDRVPTQRERGYEAVLNECCALIRATAAKANLDLNSVPIGVGMPGGVRCDNGLVKNSNTVCLNGRPFRQDLERLLERRVAFDNDANCFALAEARLGAAKEAKGLVFGVIMGTGVGGGLVFKGQVWSGPQGLAGEWGHHTLYSLPGTALSGTGDPQHDLRPCYCGRSGCVEQYLSGPAVEADYQRTSGIARGLPEIYQRAGQTATPDPDAVKTIDRFLDAFGQALGNVINIADPEMIVLGGGVSNVDLLVTEGARRARNHVFHASGEECTTPIVRNELGDSAGVLGAALLAVSTSVD